MGPIDNLAFIPDFETWVNACFTLSKDDEFWGRSQLTAQELAEYLARLFENPAFLATKFTRQQLAEGIWLICGCVLGFFREALDPSVPEAARRRWLRAIRTCYTELDPLCSSVPIIEQNSDQFCVAVCMLWDMDSLA